MKVYLPIGLIGSGKSTWAKAFIKDDDEQNTKIVGGDEIRYMLHGGEYTHEATMENVVRDILISSTRELLSWDYDVILDECYTSLNKKLRAFTAASLPDDVKLIAVVFPTRDMQDHIDDKIMKGLRGKSVNYWKRVFREMLTEFEPFEEDEPYFSDVIYIPEQ
jgi:predicted kinase